MKHIRPTDRGAPSLVNLDNIAPLPPMKQDLLDRFFTFMGIVKEPKKRKLQNSYFSGAHMPESEKLADKIAHSSPTSSCRSDDDEETLPEPGTYHFKPNEG